jgi:hypothetical protein
MRQSARSPSSKWLAIAGDLKHTRQARAPWLRPPNGELPDESRCWLSTQSECAGIHYPLGVEQSLDLFEQVPGVRVVHSVSVGIVRSVVWRATKREPCRPAISPGPPGVNLRISTPLTQRPRSTEFTNLPWCCSIRPVDYPAMRGQGSGCRLFVPAHEGAVAVHGVQRMAVSLRSTLTPNCANHLAGYWSCQISTEGILVRGRRERAPEAIAPNMKQARLNCLANLMAVCNRKVVPFTGVATMKVWEWLAKAAPGTYYFTDEIEAHFKAETGLEGRLQDAGDIVLASARSNDRKPRADLCVGAISSHCAGSGPFRAKTSGTGGSNPSRSGSESLRTDSQMH